MKEHELTLDNMLIKDMTNSHILNAINYWKRHLESKPAREVYFWMSDYWDDMVESENRMNDEIEDEVKQTITKLEREAQKRALI